MDAEGEPRLLDLREHVPALAGPGWRARLVAILEWALGILRIREIAEELEVRTAAGERPFEAFRRASDVRVCDHGVAEAIPRSGGLLVIANHPFGGADAIALAAVVGGVRTDTRIVANEEIARMKSLAPVLFPMEIMGQEGAARRNVMMMRRALEHLQAGGTLVMFPAGAVAHWQWDQAMVADPPWSDHAARLLLRSKVPVLPVGFSGKNPGWFQFFGAIHPLLRTALIFRALLGMRGREVACFAGRLFTPADYPETPEALTKQLQKRVSQVFQNQGN